MNFKEFKKKYELKKVEEYPNTVVDKIMVSVVVATYQHAPYIKECLDGILMQQTHFPFEILLGEDGSTDGTREICLDYAQKHPDKIRLFLHHRENNIHIGGRPTGRFNFLYNLYHASGKYIAYCEGDDYWTDPAKLQKQVGFLTQNSDYGLVFTETDVLNEKTGNQIKNYDKTFKRKIPTGSVLKNLMEGNPYKTCTALFRGSLTKTYLENNCWQPFFRMADLPLWIHIASKKKIGYLSDSMAVRRELESSASNFKSIYPYILFQRNIYKMKLYYSNLYNFKFDKKGQKKNYCSTILTFSLKKSAYKEMIKYWRNIDILIFVVLKEKIGRPIYKFMFK